MTSTSTSSSNRQLRTRLLLNEALPQNNGGIGCNIGIRGGDSATINISIMGVAIVVVIFCLLCKNMVPSDDNNDNDNNDTDSNSNSNSNTNANANNADNSSYAVNHKMNPEEEEEEERKKNIIFKLFRSEHMEEKITCNHIRRHSGERKIIIKEDGALSSFDEEEGHRIAMLSSSSSSSSSSSPSHNSNSNSNSNTEKTVSDVCAICLDEYHEGDTIVYPSNHENCRHAFHRDCLARYFIKIKEEDIYPCPCCRQNFFLTANAKSKKKKKDDDDDDDIVL